MKAAAGPGAARRRDRWRPAMQIGVLLLLLAGSAVLAMDTWLAHRGSAASARQSSRDLALEAAAQLSRTGESVFGSRILRTFYPVSDVARYDTPARRKSFFANALGTATRCFEGEPCDGGLGRTAFHLDLRTGAWQTEGAPLDSATAHAFRDSVQREATTLYERRWEVSRLHIPVAGRRRTILYRVAYGDDKRPATAVGFEVDLPRVGREVFGMAIKRGPLLVSVSARDSTPNGEVALRVASASGDVFLSSGVLPADTGLVAHLPRESDMGTYHIDVGAPAASMSAITARAGRRLVTTYLAFGASVLLVVLAIVQARREQALTRLREAFVAGVSHELRTPLAQIRLYGEMLQHGFVRNDAEHDDAVGVIVRESARLTHLVENVLAYSRSGIAGAPIRGRRVPLIGVLEQVRQATDALAAAAGMRLVIDTAPDVVARSDEALLVQVLVNFVDNAVRHGIGSREITLSAQSRADHVVVAVSDGGPGIPRHERSRVWERFVRLEERTPSPGNGIGLSVAAAIVERLGGAVWIEDAPGGGARFVVQLPVSDAGSPASEPPQPPQPPQPLSGEPSPPPRAARA